MSELNMDPHEEQRQHGAVSFSGKEFANDERVVKVRVENEENGDSFDLDGFEQTRLKSLFVEMYKKLGVAQQSDDRLRCEEGGGDVFGYADLTLREYIERGDCKCLVWLFAGGTGGASCR